VELHGVAEKQSLAVEEMQQHRPFPPRPQLVDNASQAAIHRRSGQKASGDQKAQKQAAAGEGRHKGSACEERAQPPPARPDSMESVSSGIWLQATTMWNRFQFSLPKSRIGISLFILI